MTDDTLKRRASQVIAIGLEAAEPRLIERWCDEGELPHLAELRRKGSYRRLWSPTEISSGATWASVNTGCSPGKHGIAFYHRQIESGSYRIVKKYAEDMRPDCFWVPLARSGHRVAVVDLPESHVVREFNGSMLVGWGGEAVNGRRGSWPPELFSGVRARFGPHPLEGWYQARPRNKAGWVGFLEKIKRATRTRGSIALSILEQESWDLIALAFPESHWAGHFFWHLTDETHPEYDRELAQSCSTAILQVYREIDQVIGGLLQRASAASVLVFSNTGMGPNYSGVHLLHEVLERLGLGARPGGAAPKRERHIWGPYALKTMERLATPTGIEWARRLVPERTWDHWTRRLLTLGNGWARSRAFCVPSDYSGAIRFNLRGREPDGRVAPDEYDALCEELVRELEALIDPDTGRRAVAHVVKVRAAYPGDQVDALPDLIVRWTGEAPIRALSSPRVGTVRGELPDKRSGAHMPYGFLMSAGPGLAHRGTLGAARVIDLAPTIYHLLGARDPGCFDGSALLDLIES